jgi:UDP-glucose 4-epimerase
VSDVGVAHIAAIARMLEGRCTEAFEVFNLGTGKGYSVLDMIQAFERATGVPCPYQIHPRRPGDVEAVYADTRLANKELHWFATRSLDEMMRSAWAFEQTLSK